MTTPIIFPTADEIFGPEPRDRNVLETLPGGGYAYSMVDHNVRIEARYLRRHFNQLHAEIDVQCAWAGVSRHGNSLSCADLNLSNQMARIALAKHCAARAHTKAGDFDWIGAVDAACLEIIRAERRGDDSVIVLDDAPEVANREVDVYGLHVPMDAASIVIAHGDSMKSMLALFVLGTLALRGYRVLYLDWEWSADRHRARKRRLFGDDRLENLRYLKGYAPLVHDFDRIRRYCDEHQIAFLVVDSVGLACDGKLTDDDVAIRFHRALASLPPALCAAHVPKSSLGPDGKGDAIGPFGSVFFSNLCRASWLVKKQPSESDDLVTVGLFPQKQNDSRRHRPVALEFAFAQDGRIHVESVDMAGVEGLAEKLPIAVRIRALLRSGPPRSYAEIAAELCIEKVNSIVQAMRRDDSFTRVPSSPDGIHRFSLIERRQSE